MARFSAVAGAVMGTVVERNSLVMTFRTLTGSPHGLKFVRRCDSHRSKNSANSFSSTSPWQGSGLQ